MSKRSVLAAVSFSVDVCRKGVSALHCAVTNGHVDMLRLLLQSGANANIRGQTYQRTPIFMAGEAGNDEMVSLLIHHGAKLNLTDQYGMKTTTPVLHFSTDLPRLSPLLEFVFCHLCTTYLYCDMPHVCWGEHQQKVIKSRGVFRGGPSRRLPPLNPQEYENAVHRARNAPQVAYLRSKIEKIFLGRGHNSNFGYAYAVMSRLAN